MSVTSDSVKKAYRRYARYYDLVFGAVFHPGRRTAIEHLHCRAGDRILEVGVGTGLSLAMYPQEVKVVGIDLSGDMLKLAKKRIEDEPLPQVEALLQMDAQQMSFPDNSFDSVVAMYVASVVPDARKLVDEIRRVCKPGGKIVFLNHFQNKNPLIRKAEALVQRLAKHIGFHPDFPLSHFLEQTGFEVTTAIPVNVLDYWTVLVGVNDKKPR
ncbi:MAG: methyltransferase domain-containing protein [Bdellovibrionales bacterium]|nr:methyltransferase domain-containing protein [Bdellovibrionales bacterium]